MEAFRCEPNDFSSTSFATFDMPFPFGPVGMTVGDNPASGPWDGPVVVTDVDTHLIKLETLKGHMEAGWVCFSTRQDGGELVFEIESVAR